MTANGLPADWKDARLGDLIDGFDAGRNLKAHGRPAGADEFGVLKISAVSWGEFNPAENKALLPGDAPRPRELVRKGDVLISRANTTELVGAVVQVDADYPKLMLPDKVLRLKVRASIVDPAFLVQALRLPRARAHFEANATGTSDSMRNLSQPKMEAAPVPLPPLNEQQRIVRKLTTLQAGSRRARAALDAVPPLLEKLRQSILAAAFRGDLTKEWRAKNPDVEPASELLTRIRVERRKKWEEAELAKLTAKGKAPTDDRWKAKYKEPAPVDASGLPELPVGWCWASLDELVVDGPSNGFSPKSEAAGSGTPTLKLSATTSGSCLLNEQTTKSTVAPIAADEAYWLRRGDVLIQRANTLEYVGVSAVFDGPDQTYIYPDLMMRVRAVPSIGAALLWRALSTDSSRAYMRDRATGTSGNMPKINGQTVRSIPIPLGPVGERAVMLEMVNRAGDVVSSRERGARELALKVPALERALLAKAFRGAVL